MGKSGLMIGSVPRDLHTILCKKVRVSQIPGIPGKHSIPEKTGKLPVNTFIRKSLVFGISGRLRFFIISAKESRE